MSMKRTAPEANDDEETTEAALQHEDKAKRAKLIPKYDKTLQDLPTRLLECILVEAVVMEVRSMRLAKSVWKEKADLVISRLRTVCSQWNSILTTDRFLTEVHRILEGIDQETIRLEILHQSRIQRFSRDLTTLKEEMFILFYESYDESEHSVYVYDRNNLAEVKDVIALPGKYPLTLDACNVSNCVYVLCYHEDLNENSGSILRIQKVEEHGFNILPWMSDLRKTPFISVLPNGILSVTHGCNPVALRNYDAKGSMVLSADIHGFRLVKRVMQKSNGNLIIAAMNDRLDTVLTEIDLDGKLKGQHTGWSKKNRTMIN